MAISVAPLTTVVMSSVAKNYVGAASGVNNAISRISGVLAIAGLGLVMTMLFNQQLEERSKASSLPINIRQEIIAQESKLADIKTNNKLAKQLIRESFIYAYDTILWIAVALCLFSSLTAGIFINKKNDVRGV